MILIVHFGSKKVPQIQAAVEDAGYACRVVDWEKFTEQEMQSCNGVIFSGSPTFLTEIDHSIYHEKFGCVKAGKTAVLGICFGHQVLGIIHGARIFRGPAVRVAIPIRVVKQDGLFAGLQASFEMTEDHTEGISLPASFVHLASSDQYLVEAMRHPTLPIWGVQFHPETAGAVGWQLIRNFLAHCRN
ncbi:MAG: glutamine amidotransferase-related protein [Bacteroidia bacterium]